MKDKKSYQLNPSIDRLTLRLVLPEEQERFNDLLKQHHYLHSAGSAGETLRYVAQIDGQWMGLLLWGAASYRLKDRDEWIGWDGAQRHARLKLVVQNRRFLILPGVDLANLASKTLGMCLRVLADHWQEAFGYRPLVAETFVDPQIHRGTCYEASGWTPLGLSAGYGRQREDFYQRHERPKQIWVKPLKANALELLRASGPLPAAQSQALNETDNSHAVCLKVEQMSSLWERFNQIEDFRRKAGLRYRLATVLSMIVLGTMCGKQTLKGIVRLAHHLNQAQLRALRSWKNPKTGRYKAPCYDVFYRVLQNVKAELFDKTLTEFICLQDGCLPRDIAVDGKTLKGTNTEESKALHLVAAVDHQSAQTLAQVATADKSNEITAAQTLLRKMPILDGSTFTFDAMHNQKETAHIVVEELSADYVIQIKDNQPNMHQYAQNLFSSTPFFSTNPWTMTMGDSKYVK